LLAGYPDRVGRVLPAAGAAHREILLAGGGRLRVSDAAGLAEGELVVVLDADEHRDGRRVTTHARALVPVEPEWLLELFPERVVEEPALAWNEAKERVDASERLTCEGLVLEERPWRASPREIEALLYTEAARLGPAAFCERPVDLARWLGRLAFVRRHRPDLDLPGPTDALQDATLRDACVGRRSFAEIRKADLPGLLARRLGPTVAATLDRLAPASLRLAGGRRLAIDYPSDGDPSAASRLQDFFGLADAPRVLEGRVPLVLHLLAPNGRDVQVTTDLAGFWQRHYPALAHELRRRYPRHAWPDDPVTSAPLAPERSRRR
jgi:ATP-dependent helicase HrpB